MPQTKARKISQQDLDDKLMFELCAREWAKLFRIPYKEVVAPKRGTLDVQLVRKCLTQSLADYMLKNGAVNKTRLGRAIGKDKTTAADHLEDVDNWILADPMLELAMNDVCPKVTARALAELNMIRLRPAFWAAFKLTAIPSGLAHWSTTRLACAFETFGRQIHEASTRAICGTKIIVHPCIEAIMGDPTIQRILAPLVEGDRPSEDEGAAIAFSRGAKGQSDSILLSVGLDHGSRLKDAKDAVLSALKRTGYGARSFGVLKRSDAPVNSMRLALVPMAAGA